MNHRLHVLSVIGVVLALAGVGCRATHSVKGKVIEGTLSFVAVVNATDERLKSPGLEGAQVEGRLGGGVFAQATTDKKGDFSLDTKEQGILMRPVEFSASMAGFRPAAATLNLPSSNQRLLIIVPPLGYVPVPK